MMVITRFATPTEVSVRHSSPQVDNLYIVVLDPRRLIRWIYVGRLSIASSIFVAAIVTWFQTEARHDVRRDRDASSVRSSSPGISFFWTEVNRKPLTNGFLYVQLIVDLLVVTMVVHVTSAPNAGSQFAALYILVNAAAALLLPIGGALLIAALGLAMYVLRRRHRQRIQQRDGVAAVRLLGRRAEHRVHQRAAPAGRGGARTARRGTHPRPPAREGHPREHQERHRHRRRNRQCCSSPTRSASELLGIDLEAHVGSPVLRGDPRASRRCSPTRSSRPCATPRSPCAPRARSCAPTAAFPFGVTTTSAGGDGADVGRERDRDLPGHFRPEAPRAAATCAPQRLEAVAELSRVAGARDQESARVDSQRRRAAFARAPSPTSDETDARQPHRARVGPAVAPALGVPRLRARARHAPRAGGRRRPSRAAPRRSPSTHPARAGRRAASTSQVPDGDRSWCSATTTCCTARSSTSRSTPCRRSRPNERVRLVAGIAARGAAPARRARSRTARWRCA